MKQRRFDPEGLLAYAGLIPEQEAYRFFLHILTEAINRETRRAKTLARTGARLLELADSKNVTEIRRIAAAMARTEASGSALLPVTRGVLQAAKMYAVESERQSANRDRAQTERNHRISRRFRELIGTMSERAAARRIRSEQKLQISESRIRQIAVQKTG